MNRRTTLLSHAEQETRNIIHVMQPLISNGHTLIYKTYYPNTIYLIIKDHTNNKTIVDSNVSYFPTDGTNNKEAVIRNVNSTVGNKSGTLLLYLHIYILIKLNISNVTLNNSCDDPERASIGIYKMFDVDKRHQNQHKFIGVSIHDQLIQSCGDMRLRVVDIKTWTTYFKQLVLSFNTDHTFKWNISRLTYILCMLNQHNSTIESRRTKKAKISKAGRIKKILHLRETCGSINK